MLIHILILAASFLLFFFGLYIFRNTLNFLPPEKISNFLLKTTKTPLTGTLSAAAITALTQSSSIIMVITIGLVNSRMLTFPQTIGIILGANIGTCLTVEIMSLNPGKLALLITLSGIILLPTKHTMGRLLLGLGSIFLGLRFITSSSAVLINSEIIKYWIETTSNSSLNGILIGTAASGMAQSSSVIIGLAIALAQNGMLNLNSTIPIILGSNLGTCITALLASIGTNKTAKQVALAHIILNLLGIFIFLPLTPVFSKFMQAITNSLPAQIAHAHTTYNILCSALLLPFARQFAVLIQILLPDKN